MNIHAKILFSFLLIAIVPHSLAQKITLYVHGTKLPGIDIKRGFFGGLIPQGLHCASELTESNHPHDIISALCTGTQMLTTKQDLYFFGWDGLFPIQREQEAQKLYDALMIFIQDHALSDDNPLHLQCITHSHGGSLIMHLAHLIDTHKSPIIIDALVLMGCPIQQMTEKFVHTATIKKIYNIYSVGDELQKNDPQGLYPEARQNNANPPLFSRRTFTKKRENLWEISIKQDDRFIGHQEFLSPIFLLSVAQIIAIADSHKAGKLRINIVTSDYQPIEHINLKIQK